MDLKEVFPKTFGPHHESELRDLAATAMPEEACGIIYSHGIIVQYPNTFVGDKCHGWNMDVSYSDDIRCIWHSHPNGLQEPSRDDMPLIRGMAEAGFPFHHVIVTLAGVFEYEVYLDGSPVS
jgi:proteasome lid subunit RPN8/RPN11